MNGEIEDRPRFCAPMSTRFSHLCPPQTSPSSWVPEGDWSQRHSTSYEGSSCNARPESARRYRSNNAALWLPWFWCHAQIRREDSFVANCGGPSRDPTPKLLGNWGQSRIICRIARPASFPNFIC